MAWTNDIKVPPVRLIPVDFGTAEVPATEKRSPNPQPMRSQRLGRPAQIATPTDIRWPMVQEFLRSSSLSPNSRKLYERELKRFLGWAQCRWSELQSRHLGLYKAYLMELEVATGKKLSKNSLTVRWPPSKASFGGCVNFIQSYA
jgi:integrase/recombinase XerD